ncbi:hypothetical protein C8F04DRAFT_1325273 [Mycena alexandri]|uniref:Uncharacterized protein n=1 Tax=Mycena alexandri TaxID=1745969 RepID=A0AAD6T439_9AGAR|nr:hypothetical protein C8F04DRAFT_1325273 [Mycena alexandri]
MHNPDADAAATAPPLTDKDAKIKTPVTDERAVRDSDTESDCDDIPALIAVAEEDDGVGNFPIMHARPRDQFYVSDLYLAKPVDPHPFVHQWTPIARPLRGENLQKGEDYAHMDYSLFLADGSFKLTLAYDIPCRPTRTSVHHESREAAAEARNNRLLNRSISPENPTNIPNSTSESVPQSPNVSIPSTPTISTPSDLTPSPEPRPILLPAIFTPRRPQYSHAPSRPTTPKTYVPDDMAPNKSTELFRGNGTAEKAHTWLRTLEQTWKWDAEDKEKLYRFEKGLHPGSQAEEWWETLDAKETAGWKALMVAFEKKWAKPKASRRGQDIVIQELMANSLDHGDLGKYVKDEDGTSVLSHVAWAETARNLLGELPGGDSAMMLKSAVRKTLPVEFRALVEDQNSTTWEHYLKAVEDVQLDRISDVVEVRETHARASSSPMPRTPSDAFAAQLLQSLGLSDLARNLGSPSRVPPTPYANPRGTYIPPAARQSQPVPLTPTSYVQRPYQTPSTMVDPHTPWAQRQSHDPFGSSTIRPPNTFTKNLLASPVSPSANRSRPVNLSGDPARDVDITRSIAENPRTYTAHPAGIQRYTNDFAGWMSQNGNSQSPDYLSFPFTPGLPSRDRNGTEVPMRETNLRNSIGAILYPAGQRTPARISQIHDVQYDLFGGHDPDQPLYEEADESENGEELAV